MAPIGTLYDLLGVASDASTQEIRHAYRRAARANHPDTHGDGSSGQMAEINHAWQVLGDPGRRSEYDLSLSSPTQHDANHHVSRGTDGWAADPAPMAARYNPLARYEDPPRFPWRFMGVMLLLGIGFVILGVVTAGDPIPAKVDNVLNPGDCVVIEPNGDAAERLCTEAHDGVVRVLLTTDEQCPGDTEPHRDRQGMGTACIALR